VVERVAVVHFLAPAAAAAGVPRSLAYRWLGEDARFAAAVEVARQVSADMREVDLMVAAESEDVVAVRCREAVLRRIDANFARRAAWRRLDRLDRAAAEPAAGAAVPEDGAAAVLEAVEARRLRVVP